MSRFKYLLAIIFLTIIGQTTPVLAQERVNIYFFYGQGCPHCGKEEEFLNKLEREKTDINIHLFEIYHDTDNANLLKDIGETLGVDVRGVPVTFIQDEYVGGFYNEEITGQQIIDKINKCKEGGCTNQIASIIKQEQNDNTNKLNNSEQNTTSNFSGATIGLGVLLLIIIGFGIYKIRKN